MFGNIGSNRKLGRKLGGARPLSRLALTSLVMFGAAAVAHAQQPGAQTAAPPFVPAPSANTPQQPAQQQPPAGANVRGIAPDAQIQQSAQPASKPAEGQPPAPATGQPPVSPQLPAAQSPAQADAPLRLDAVTTFDQLNQTGQPRPNAPTIPAPAGPRRPGRESVPAQAPAELPLDVPPVAQGFRAAPGALPELGRVGVNTAEQRPLALREAIELALQNAKEIEVARSNVRAAELIY
jgi:hypothetical protein